MKKTEKRNKTSITAVFSDFDEECKTINTEYVWLQIYIWYMKTNVTKI